MHVSKSREKESRRVPRSTSPPPSTSRQPQCESNAIKDHEQEEGTGKARERKKKDKTRRLAERRAAEKEESFRKVCLKNRTN